MTNQELTKELTNVMTSLDRLELVVANIYEYVFDEMNIVHSEFPLIPDYPECDTSDNGIPF